MAAGAAAAEGEETAHAATATSAVVVVVVVVFLVVVLCEKNLQVSFKFGTQIRLRIVSFWSRNPPRTQLKL